MSTAEQWVTPPQTEARIIALTAPTQPTEGTALETLTALLPERETLARVASQTREIAWTGLKAPLSATAVGANLWWQVAQYSDRGVARTLPSIARFITAERQRAVAEHRSATASELDKAAKDISDNRSHRKEKREALREAKTANDRARFAEFWAGVCFNTRVWPTAIGTIGGTGYGAWEWWHAPLALQIAGPLGGAAAAALLGGLGFGAIGRWGSDAPSITRPRKAGNFEPERVLEAMRQLSKKLADAIETGEAHIPMSGYDETRGCYRFEIETPLSARKLAASRDAWATALGLPENRIRLELAPTISARTFILQVFDNDQSERSQGEWPYADAPRLDAFGPTIVGEDVMGDRTTVTAPDADILVTGAKGSGKTETIKNLLAARALDPRHELKVIDAKDTDDYADFEPVLTDYVRGTGWEDIKAATELLEWVRDTYCPATSAAMREAGVRKITADVAHLPGLASLTVAMDECQAIFKHPDFGKRATAAVSWIQSMGRAWGVKFIFGTQIPSADCLPSEINRNITGARFCHRMEFQTEVAMAIGSSAYETGGAANEIPASAKGTAVLKGGGNDGLVTTQAFLLTPQLLAPVIAEGVKRRGGVTKRLEVLPEADTENPDGHGSVLDDFMSLMPETGDSGPGLHYQMAVDQLRAKFPGRYGDRFNVEMLKATLFTHGIEPQQVSIPWLEKPNRTGWRWDVVDAARKGLRP